MPRKRPAPIPFTPERLSAALAVFRASGLRITLQTEQDGPRASGLSLEVFLRDARVTRAALFWGEPTQKLLPTSADTPPALPTSTDTES